MEESRAAYASKNILMAIAVKFFDQLLNFIVRTIFIKTLSIEYLGINGLFNNILSFLSMAELGVGSAIVYLMYKPIAENDTQKICTYINVYRKIYAFLGVIVFIIGISLTPFLNFFIAERPDIPERLELIYIFYILKTLSTYFIAYKQSIFIANQKGYIVQKNIAFFTIIKCFIQIVFLVTTHQFLIYLIVDVLINYTQNVFIAIIADKEYPYLREKTTLKLKIEERIEIKKNIGAMFFHKIGSVILNSSDNLILSKYISMIMVGIYSNYSTILVIARTLIWTVFDAIVPSVGNLCAKSNNEQKYFIFKAVQLLNLWISGLCTISLGILINPFIVLWIGEKYLLPQTTVWVIIFAYYVQMNMRAIEMFRSATGLFYKDRFVPLIQCVINIVISVIMVKIWGVSGIFIGTVCSILFTGFWIQPYMVFKYIFKKALKSYFFIYGKCMCITVIALIITNYCSCFFSGNSIITFIWKVLCCAVFPNLIFLIFYFRTSEFIYLKNKFIQLLFLKMNKKGSAKL